MLFVVIRGTGAKQSRIYPPCLQGHKKGVPGGGGGGGAGSSSASHNTVPHISKMLAGQFNPIAFMHNRDNAKQSTGDGSGGGRNNQVESPFTG